MTPEREKEIRGLDYTSPLPHPLTLRDELLAEIDRLRDELYDTKTYNILEIDELKVEIKRLRAELNHSVYMQDKVREERNKAEEKLAVAVEALEYYEQFSKLPEDIQLKERIGGGRAWQTLQKIQGESK